MIPAPAPNLNAAVRDWGEDMIKVCEIFSPDKSAVAPQLPEHLYGELLNVELQNNDNFGRASAVLYEAAEAMRKSQPDIDFSVLWGKVASRSLEESQALAFWRDLNAMFPLEQWPIKYLMRHLEKTMHQAFGLEKLRELYPNAGTNLAEGIACFAGLNGLGCNIPLEDFLLFVRLGRWDDVTLNFSKQLRNERRYKLALAVLLKVSPEGRGRQEVIEARKELMVDLLNQKKQKPRIVVPRREAISHLVREAARGLRPLDLKFGLGPVVFFTGQLGAGGAERQMSQISAELHSRYLAGQPVGGLRLRGPIHVCLRNTDTVRKADFFLPVLQKVGLEPHRIDTIPIPGLDSLNDFPVFIQSLVAMLRKGLRDVTLKLIPYFREVKPDVVYLWQDGGALAAGLAALLAGTPRVVISFRGLPPNKRADRMREEMPTLFREMFRLPQVSFSANSAAVARDYEHWLDLPTGSIHVIPNAVRDLPTTGDASDQAFWDEVTRRSPGCTRTVASVFRFEPNKRPLIWIEIAAAYARQDPTTRFVMVGSGGEHKQSEDLIQRLGMSDRIFLAGARKNVGFYLGHATMLMHLAETEGLPNAIIEAQMAGLPVLATPAGGTAEVILDGETGKLLPSAEQVDVAVVVDELSGMLSDDARLAAMGRAAVERARPRYNLDNILVTTIRLLAALVVTDEPGPPA